MINSNDLSGKLAVDANDLNGLRSAAKQNSPEALKTAAKQFEALFMNMVMKSMREATPQDGLFDSQQGKMYTSMLDQQISQNLAKRGVGLADVLIRQLSNNKNGSAVLPGKDGLPASFTPSAPSTSSAPPLTVSDINADAPHAPGKLYQSRLAQIAAFQEHLTRQSDPADQSADFSTKMLLGQTASIPVVQPAATHSRSRSAHVRAFEDRMTAHAEEASRTTGIPAKFMLGQAALESGWGRREIKAADGTASHNLFGIKATGGWKGKVVEVATTEYVNGTPQRRMEKFRAYDSYAEGFKDYANLLSKNPRYENVLANAQDASSFAQGLQRAGYATDPNYAAKLTRIITQSLSA